MKITDAVQEFLELHELDNCSVKTIRTYEQRLRYFYTWLLEAHGIDEVEELKLEHLRGWMAYLKKTPTYRGRLLSDESIYSYGQSLLAFCHWLEREEKIERAITPRFKLPRVEKKFVPTYSREDVEKLLAACEESYHKDQKIQKALVARNKAIVTLFVDTGIRLNELVSLRLGDVDKVSRVILVHRKGNKWQQVPVSSDGFKPLHHYLSSHRSVLAGGGPSRKDDPVFLADDGCPLTMWGVSALFKRLKKRTGIDGKRVSAHQCRRYMATTQLAMGRSPLDVQRQLGHTSLKMTNHYASLSIQHLRKSHEKYSPLREGDWRDDVVFGSGYWDE
ncbi:integrase/recombinase XerD [Thermosporothrix hazakensis]|jgi:site-specific recombinase XerD|uniref:Integrase/recombinase XerD n=1 Tax=Thermosporothrix hazakensis TaxID=644383 RepID=A0A326TRD9_THEHA|nr:tyrosine-type recombinase/integrase [Thermosporothrix hazakensis]PZW18023.1 integrase/recombinase XerD [Thermosporothrix hazakensis]GCE48034.1 tyrosine recombinase XerC [Thermosporothrix hazakensis]